MCKEVAENAEGKFVLCIVCHRRDNCCGGLIAKIINFAKGAKKEGYQINNLRK